MPQLLACAARVNRESCVDDRQRTLPMDSSWLQSVCGARFLHTPVPRPCPVFPVWQAKLLRCLEKWKQMDFTTGSWSQAPTAANMASSHPITCVHVPHSIPPAPARLLLLATRHCCTATITCVHVPRSIPPARLLLHCYTATLLHGLWCSTADSLIVHACPSTTRSDIVSHSRSDIASSLVFWLVAQVQEIPVPSVAPSGEQENVRKSFAVARPGMCIVIHSRVCEQFTQRQEET